MRTTLLLAALLTLGALMAMFTGDHSTAAETQGSALKHLVMYKFKPELSEQQVGEVVAAFDKLAKSVDTIIGYERGLNVSKEGKSDGLTHVFAVTFKDEAGLQKYLEHPAHQEYVSVVRDRREKVVVVDYWTK